MTTLLNEKDEIIMNLVHYFVTEENYTPINVQGAQNEVWLENLEAPYKIIRINAKYIHNNEQLDQDLFKIDFVVRQIKKKTLSFKMKVLNICLDLGSSVQISKDDKSISTIKINDLNDIKKDKLVSTVYPKIKNMLFKSKNTGNSLENILLISDDINNKTKKENKKYEDIFRPKKIIITKILIIICIAMFVITTLIGLFYEQIISYGLGIKAVNIINFFNKVNDITGYDAALVLLGANNYFLVFNTPFGFLRILLSSFLHGDIIHLFVNMYSLWIIGSQVENYIGKSKFLIIYLLSAIMGSLMSLLFLNGSISIGASGAIFGLMGSLLYFGYHYRLYLSTTLTSQIIPIIIINIILGFTITGIDNAAHIGGLIERC